MTTSEYQNRNRFEVNNSVDFTEFLKSLHFTDKTIFECNTLSNTIKYLRISSQFYGMLFDLLECTSTGEPVRCPYKRGSTSKEEIAERLIAGDWRLYPTKH